MSEPDHYAILGVSRKASADEIKAAYRRLVFMYHPDRNPGVDAEERMKMINVAYSVLSDPKKRAEYDLQGRFGSRPSGAGGDFRAEDYSWKKEYSWTWTWGGQGGRENRQGWDTRREYSGSRPASGNPTGRWDKSSPGSRNGSGRQKGVLSTWGAVDLALRIIGVLAVLWLILSIPMLVVFLLIVTAFLLALWLLARELLRGMAGRK
ncbi:hypothetical protein FTO70_10865 [Methanosarcina sp. KYL-1]|nr:hypothetical protein [Methanosarcina sp. KYL-1]